MALHVLQWRGGVQSLGGIASSISRRRGKVDRAAATAAASTSTGLASNVLGGVVILVVSICLVRLTLLLIATSSVAVGHNRSRILSTSKQQDASAPNHSITAKSANQGDAPSFSTSPEFDVLNGFLRLLQKNTTKSRRRSSDDDGGPYHSRKLFFQDYQQMVSKLKIFIYPCAKNDPFKHIFLPSDSDPGGNYASEAFFKKSLAASGMVTDDPSQAHFFYMPFSIARLRHDPKVGVHRIQDFVRDYVHKVVHNWPYWNRTSGSDHFYVACHSIAKNAVDQAPEVKINAVQVVCSSNYYVQGFIPHKDVTIPQIWPRQGEPAEIKTIKQRKTLAFYAGGANSPVRAELVRTWKNDTSMRIYGSRISTPYSEALLRSKFCLHVKGYEVNTARLGDALFHGCVPVVLSNHYDLPFNSVLDWRSFSVVVTTGDIPRLKRILTAISGEEFRRMQRLVLEVRKHFQWHSPPREYDVFHMVMYQLWMRRHVVRYSL